MAFATKQLNFTWAAVDGATYYKIYQNLDGISDFTQVGADTKATVVNIEIAVHRHHWMTACCMVEACNPMGCAASAAVDIASGMLGAIGYSKASNSQGGDWFGTAVALSADGNTWMQQAYLKVSNPGLDDRFGWGVAMSADGATLAVGARGEWSNATGINPVNGEVNNSAVSAGAVYVYTRSGSAWSQQVYVKAANT